MNVWSTDKRLTGGDGGGGMTGKKISNLSYQYKNLYILNELKNIQNKSETLVKQNTMIPEN